MRVQHKLVGLINELKVHEGWTKTSQNKKLHLWTVVLAIVPVCPSWWPALWILDLPSKYPQLHKQFLATNLLIYIFYWFHFSGRTLTDTSVKIETWYYLQESFNSAGLESSRTLGIPDFSLLCSQMSSFQVSGCYYFQKMALTLV